MIPNNNTQISFWINCKNTKWSYFLNRCRHANQGGLFARCIHNLCLHLFPFHRFSAAQLLQPIAATCAPASLTMSVNSLLPRSSRSNCVSLWMDLPAQSTLVTDGASDSPAPETEELHKTRPRPHFPLSERTVRNVSIGFAREKKLKNFKVFQICRSALDSLIHFDFDLVFYEGKNQQRK